MIKKLLSLYFIFNGVWASCIQYPTGRNWMNQTKNKYAPIAERTLNYINEAKPIIEANNKKIADLTSEIANLLKVVLGV
jgi:hypothetical protein